MRARDMKFGTLREGCIKRSDIERRVSGKSTSRDCKVAYEGLKFRANDVSSVLSS